MASSLASDQAWQDQRTSKMMVSHVDGRDFQIIGNSRSENGLYYIGLG
jgi:hypothetical protein